MKITIKSNVVNGKFKRNLPTILDAVKSFEGKDVLLTFEKPKKKRSNQQNSYYWAVLIPITINAIKNEWGEFWSNEKTHEFYKHHFNIVERINQETGEIIKVVKSTTENTTTQQEEYHLQIRQFLKEWFNVDAPLPNEDLILNFNK